MIKFDGESLRAALSDTSKKLVEAVGQGVLRPAGFAGAAIFRDEAKQNALSHVKTRVVYNNIIVKRLDEEASERRQVYLVTVRSGKYGADGDAFYWRFVEQGHKFVPHKPAGGKGSTWKAHRAAAQLEYGTSTVPAYPFMRPAYESKKQEAVDAMQAVLSTKIAAKLGK